MAQIFEVNPYAPTQKKQHLFAQMSEWIRCENTCHQNVKGSERELTDILHLRGMEENDIGLAISVYDTLRNDAVIIVNSRNCRKMMAVMKSTRKRRRNQNHLMLITCHHS